MLILRGIEVLWNQQLRGGVVSVDLRGVAGRSSGRAMEVLLIKGLWEKKGSGSRDQGKANWGGARGRGIGGRWTGSGEGKRRGGKRI